MPRLSLWRPQKSNDYRFFDRTISEMYTVGGLDILVHKYLGPKVLGDDGNADATQPKYDKTDPLFIQDLFLLENRDRAYDPDIYRMRGVYNVQDIDFDLTQFGLFLQNDTLFITFHYNDMIDTIGRKLMSGDVLEIPNLKDMNPLNPDIPKGLPRYYVVQDASFPAEGFSQTWFPHLWRVKATPLVNSEEYADILNRPFVTENIWDPGQLWPSGTIVNDGDNYYEAIGNVPPGTPITDTTYWRPLDINTPWEFNTFYPEGTVVIADGVYWQAQQDVPIGTPLEEGEYWQQIPAPGGVNTVADSTSTRPKDLEINDAILAQAEAEVPLSGYDTVKFYILPTNPDGTPANPSVLTIDDTTITADSSNVNSADQPTSPRSNGYTMGYLTGDGIAPNGLPVTPGVAFPVNPRNGDYALRLDYFPNRLFRYDGRRWIRIEDNVRTDLSNGPMNNTLRSSFVNNTYTVGTTDQGDIPSRQSLSELLKPLADNGNDGGNKTPNRRPPTQPGQPNIKYPPFDE
jgi:hypothetical protein